MGPALHRSLACSPAFGPPRCSASRPAPFTSKSTSRSACPGSRWSACRTPASARAATASAARSATPASSFRRIASPSTSRRPTCARPVRRSICRSRSASSPRTGIVERRHIADLVLLGELSLDGSIHATRGVLPIAAAARRDGLRGILLPAAQRRARRRSSSGLDDLRRVVARRRGPRAERSGRFRASRRAGRPAARSPPTAAAPRPRPTSPTSADSCWRGARSKSPPPAGTTCCWSARPAPARR